MVVTKQQIIKLIELVIEKRECENDEEAEKIIESGSYALAEGYETDKMKRLRKIEEEIEEIKL